MTTKLEEGVGKALVVGQLNKNFFCGIPYHYFSLLMRAINVLNPNRVGVKYPLIALGDGGGRQVEPFLCFVLLIGQHLFLS